MNGAATIFFTLSSSMGSFLFSAGFGWGFPMLLSLFSEQRQRVTHSSSNFFDHFVVYFILFRPIWVIWPPYSYHTCLDACSFPRTSIYILAFYLSPPVGRCSAHDDLSNILSHGAPLFYGRSPTTKSSFTFNSCGCT